MKMRKIAATVLLLAVAATFSLSTFAWGDSSGGRPTYRLIDEDGGEPTVDSTNCQVVDQDGNPALTDGEIVFNSIENNPAIGGDERNFVHARENTGINEGLNNVWNSHEIQVEEGKTYLVRMYVHNNSPYNMAAIAKDVTARLEIPSESGKEIDVHGYINSSNANPETVWDHVTFTSDRDFYLEYIPGTAQFENNIVGAGGSKGLNDNIVKGGGVLLGYDALDGNIPGCFEYSGYVLATVRPNFFDEKDHTYITNIFNFDSLTFNFTAVGVSGFLLGLIPSFVRRARKKKGNTP